MELRLNELKSLILTSVNVKTGTEGEHGEVSGWRAVGEWRLLIV